MFQPRRLIYRILMSTDLLDVSQLGTPSKLTSNNLRGKLKGSWIRSLQWSCVQRCPALFFKNIYPVFVVLKWGQALKCVTLFHPFVLLCILRLAVWTLIWVNIQRQATSPSVCFVLPAAFALSFMTQWGPLEAQSVCVCGLTYVNIGLLFVRSPHPAST